MEPPPNRKWHREKRRVLEGYTQISVRAMGHVVKATALIVCFPPFASNPWSRNGLTSEDSRCGTDVAFN